MKNLTIGVLGGMGTYATIHSFQQYAEVFQAKKEWERPRIIIDNRCTMPSRVRAFLYNEKVEQLVEEMADSMKHLFDSGCNRIILTCNTSHLFLPRIYELVPELEEKVIHLINTCVDKVLADGVRQVYLLGSEGTIDSHVYQNAFFEKGIKCITPDPSDYSKLRDCIEAVKQNKYTQETKIIFCNLVNRYDTCILGCTELPILYEKYSDAVCCDHIYDPVFLCIKKLKEEYDND